MKLKTSELRGAALDWAVAKCETDDTLAVYFDEDTGEPLCHDDWQDNQEFKPSTNWAQGGPIIERESISVTFYIKYGDWIATALGRTPEGRAIGYFDYSPLIAAMRCFVASKLGDEVEVPDELQGVIA